MNTFTVLRHRNFALLWLGELVSQLGDLVLKVALPFYIFQLTGSLLQTGLAFIVETLPVILFGSLAGVLADRWNRRAIMIVVDVLRAGVLLLLLTVHSSGMIWLVYVVACVQSFLTLFFDPAYEALLPSLVPDEEQLTSANALSAFGTSITSLMGPLIGGALFAAFHIAGVVLLDTSSFVFSALMVLLIVAPQKQAEEADEGEEEPVGFSWLHVWGQWLDGLRLVKNNRVVYSIISAFGILLLAQGILNVVLVGFVERVLHGSSAIYGLLVTMQGIGTLVGSLVTGYAYKKIKPAYLFALTLSGAGILLLIWVSFPSLVLGLCILPIIGLLIVVFSVAATTMLQTSVEDEYRGRIFGAFGTTNAITMLIGLVLTSLFGDELGVTLCLGIAAILIMLNGPIVLFLMGKEKAKFVQNQTDVFASEETTQ